MQMILHIDCSRDFPSMQISHNCTPLMNGLLWAPTPPLPVQALMQKRLVWDWDSNPHPLKWLHRCRRSKDESSDSPAKWRWQWQCTTYGGAELMPAPDMRDLERHKAIKFWKIECADILSIWEPGTTDMWVTITNWRALESVKCGGKEMRKFSVGMVCSINMELAYCLARRPAVKGSIGWKPMNYRIITARLQSCHAIANWYNARPCMTWGCSWCRRCFYDQLPVSETPSHSIKLLIEDFSGQIDNNCTWANRYFA